MEPDDDKTRTHIVLTKGTMVSHYRIVERIGAGGMGEVYLAEDTELNRKVALKFLPPHLCQDEDCRKRFKREAQAAAKLSHPNIIHVYEVSEFQGRPFFAMEHIEGRSLRDANTEELDIDRIIGIAIQLCDGLQSAHASGVIHRDIKPSNIVIDSSGRPKLLDFGLATVKGGEHLTKTGSTLGTVGYMSPEQIEGKSTDARSDLFSLGIVLYELIANKSPFRRDDETATLKAILQDTPEPLARYKSVIPDDLQRIVSKLLEKDPSLRYQSAAGVIPDLKKLAPSRTSGIVVERKRDWWSRYVVPAAVAVMLVMLGIWYFGDRDLSSRGSGDDRIMLAVLPFENLGDPKDEYFADGITDEITARLMRVKDIGVIGRTSAMRFKASDEPLNRIGDALGVDYVVTGTVRWQNVDGDANMVRVTPQLVKVADQSQIWADIYSEQMTEVFAVQTSIATSIVQALDVSLTTPESNALRSIPTSNIHAYDFYIRGRENWYRYKSMDGLLAGLRMIERAVELDSTFADAYTLLSMHHSWLYFQGHDHTESRSNEAWQAALKAQQHDSLGLVYPVALGHFYYYCRADYSRALEYFELALEQSPNNVDAWFGKANVTRRMGLLEESLGAFQKGLVLDPLSFIIRGELCSTARFMREFELAISTAEQGLELYPGNPYDAWNLLMAHLDGKGDMESAAAVLEVPLPTDIRGSFLYALARHNYHICDRNFESALIAARDILEAGEDYRGKAWGHVCLGHGHRFAGNTDVSRVHYDSALQCISAFMGDDSSRHRLLPPSRGPVLAGLGLRHEAILAAREEVADVTSPLDALQRSEKLEALVRTYTMTGEYDLAIDVLDTLLSAPSWVTVHELRLHPAYDSLRDNPRFQALIEKYEKEHGT